jgi:catechol 2,3-dioxygenase-like lactoylglutathione lyase family enzyme
MTIEARLAAVGIVASDLGRTLDFYRRCGLPVPTGAEDQPHVEVPLGAGLRLLFDTEDTIRSFHPDWRPPERGGRLGIAFELPDPVAVDAAYAELTGAGGHGELPPFDAPWGQRYAVVHDPDGNGVDLYAPLS